MSVLKPPPAGDTLPPEHFADLARLEDTYWWHQVRYDAAQQALVGAGLTAEDSLGDVGCGTGGFLRYLRAHGHERTAGFDVSPVALAAAAASGAPVHRVDLGSPFALPGAPWDALVALDVVEHLGDDAMFFRCVADALRPGGLLFVTVPAFPHLFSRWDEALRHYRRYSRRGLVKATRAAPLKPLAVSYLFSFAYPAALLRRWARWHEGAACCEFPSVSRPLDRLLRVLGRLEVALPPRLRPPWGTTVALLARRSGETRASL